MTVFHCYTTIKKRGAGELSTYAAGSDLLTKTYYIEAADEQKAKEKAKTLIMKELMDLLSVSSSSTEVEIIKGDK